MSIRTVAPRAGVAIVFMGLSALVLVGASTQVPEGIGEEGLPTSQSSYFIVTNETLRPAFVSLSQWLEETGGSSLVCTLEEIRPDLGLVSAGVEVDYLHRICRRQGFDGLILGGRESFLGLPEFTPQEGLFMARVTTLDQAWAYVRDCRRRGLLLSADGLAPRTGGSFSPGLPQRLEQRH